MRKINRTPISIKSNSCVTVRKMFRFGLVVIVTLFLSALPPASSAQIIFSSERSGNGDIYVMDADGTNPVRLTHDQAPN